MNERYICSDKDEISIDHTLLFTVFDQRLFLVKFPDIDNRFFSMNIIGSGLFGNVYAAYNKASLELVAIKHMLKCDADGGREANIQHGLQHENILRLFKCIEGDLDWFLVLEFCADGTLDDKIISGQLNEETSKGYFMQLCNAVHYLHDVQRLVHRDIKPSNILLLQETIKLADFGLCSPIDAQSGTMCGTKRFCAPEIFIDDSERNEMVDVWAMGVTLFKMNSGMYVFVNEYVIQRVLHLNYYA